MPRREVWRSFF
uniref:Uncharacterized protein n=1 Tax=Anguilla anguilla TaxID=7936 RepID=A0A0E9RH67_ANGAN